MHPHRTVTEKTQSYGTTIGHNMAPTTMISPCLQLVVPNETTTYWCKAFTLPNIGKHHMIKVRHYTILLFVFRTNLL